MEQGLLRQRIILQGRLLDLHHQAREMLALLPEQTVQELFLLVCIPTLLEVQLQTEQWNFG